MFRPQGLPLRFEHFAVQLLRFGETLFLLQKSGQGAHGNQCAGMLRPQHSPGGLNQLSLHFFRLGVMLLLGENTSEIEHISQH